MSEKPEVRIDERGFAVIQHPPGHPNFGKSYAIEVQHDGSLKLKGYFTPAPPQGLDLYEASSPSSRQEARGKVDRE